jgi:hypothetical protein
MKRMIICLAIGAALGYWWGFSDAQVNKHDIVTRAVDRVGGKTRSAVRNDLDRVSESIDR